MRVLVIGGTGFIGPDVVQRLSRMGHEITLFHRGQTMADWLPGVQHLTASINTDQHLVADTTRIREELGYGELVSQDEALRRTIAWERAHPPDEVDPGRFDYAAEDAVLTGRSDQVREGG